MINAQLLVLGKDDIITTPMNNDFAITVKEFDIEKDLIICLTDEAVNEFIKDVEIIRKKRK